MLLRGGGEEREEYRRGTGSNLHLYLVLELCLVAACAGALQSVLVLSGKGGWVRGEGGEGRDA